MGKLPVKLIVTQPCYYAYAGLRVIIMDSPDPFPSSRGSIVRNLHLGVTVRIPRVPLPD
jgi:hypothetical protein